MNRCNRCDGIHNPYALCEDGRRAAGQTLPPLSPLPEPSPPLSHRPLPEPAMPTAPVERAPSASPATAPLGPALATAPPAMPSPDKVMWFAVVPVALVVLGFALPRVYDHPFPVLLDLWLLTAIGSWVARRPYRGWAVKWRWAAAVLWAVQLVIAAQSPREGTRWLVQCDLGGRAWSALVERRGSGWRDMSSGGEVVLPDASRCAFREWNR